MHVDLNNDLMDAIMTPNKLHIWDLTMVQDSTWYNGYRAFLNGAPCTDNPHPFQSVPYYHWQDGWNTSRQDWIEQKSRTGNELRPEN